MSTVNKRTCLNKVNGRIPQIRLSSEDIYPCTKFHSDKKKKILMDRGILNKATSADFDPVPGFTLSSICGMFLRLVVYVLTRDDT